MRPFLAAALSLLAFAQSWAEDVALEDGRVVRDASVKAPLPDGRFVVHGKGDTGIDYAACVPVAMLPQSIRIRLAVEPAQASAPIPERPRDAVEFGKPEVRKLHEEGGEVFFAWKIAATNNTGATVVLRSSISILNKEDFPLADAIGEQRAIGPWATATLSGSSSMKSGLWEKRERVSVRFMP